jgi:hypothetical protein
MQYQRSKELMYQNTKDPKLPKYQRYQRTKYQNTKDLKLTKEPKYQRTKIPKNQRTKVNCSFEHYSLSWKHSLIYFPSYIFLVFKIVIVILIYLLFLDFNNCHVNTLARLLPFGQAQQCLQILWITYFPLAKLNSEFKREY